jgi:hypothetical protein
MVPPATCGLSVKNCQEPSHLGSVFRQSDPKEQIAGVGRLVIAAAGRFFMRSSRWIGIGSKVTGNSSEREPGA